MKHNSKIAIIGGTGKSGKYLVAKLLNEGYQLKLLLRNPERSLIKSSLIEIVKGDARHQDAVVALAEGCQYIVSMLGQPKGEPTIFSEATKNVLHAMDVYGIDRYVLTTGLNVDTPSDKKSSKTKMATDWMRENYPQTTNDKQVEYDLLSKSHVKWTLVRLPMIELTDLRSDVLVSLEDCPGDKISAADLASFVFGQLEDDTYHKKAPFIANV